MTDHHCTPEEAFDLLVELSRDSNVPLREVARALVYQQQTRARTPTGDAGSTGAA